MGSVASRTARTAAVAAGDLDSVAVRAPGDCAAWDAIAWAASKVASDPAPSGIARRSGPHVGNPNCAIASGRFDSDANWPHRVCPQPLREPEYIARPRGGRQ